ncbi:MAG TPA: hypothetical protein VFX59_11980 [Polyangiales bacterium]|nr:hypothetical protein [Polyangiales bacterium]
MLKRRAQHAVLAFAWAALAGACNDYTVPEARDRSFSDCCGGAGTCVGRALVSPDDATRLPVDSCGEGLLCAPSDLVDQDTALLKACTSASTGAEGRCLPSCMPELQNRAGIARDDCPENKLCTPCFNPIDGSDTRACRLGKDTGPTRPGVTFPGCCSDLGKCVPSALVPVADAAKLGKDSCAEANLCVPTALAADSRAVPTTCHVKTTGAEGRCLPACLPQVAAMASELAQDDCSASELCTPCFDPRDGKSTGSCALGADLPKEPPVVFGNCCGDLGRCVPDTLVPASSKAKLGQDSCGAANLCAPAWLALDPTSAPDSCTVAATQAEGRCLAACLPDIAARASQLRQDGCGMGMLCAPCYDPITGTSSGACALGGDKGPTKPAITFDACCGSAGLCVPSSLVDDSDEKKLGKDSCDEGDALCVPAPLAKDPKFVPRTCTVSKLSAEGRCLPACLPAVAAQRDGLAQDGCDAAELCTPCFSPIDGSNTGACNIGADPGPQAPPSMFAECCSAQGRCVPPALIPAPNRTQLGVDVCATASDLCLPDRLLLDPDSIFKDCTLRGSNAEGRCLPACLPSVAARASQLEQRTCELGSLCTPCFDPFTGAATGACTIGGDKGPKTPAMPFASCGNELGRCVPSELVPATDRTRLSKDSCASATDLCVPSPLAMNPSYHFAGCTQVLTGAEGRCLPSFLPDVAARATQLQQDSCAAGHLCTPCFEPVDGMNTGACALGGDAPTKPATLFGDCCGELGRCVPTPFVPADNASQLDGTGCAASNLCVPETLARNPKAVAPSCRIVSTGAEGRCLPACLPQIAARASQLTQETCAAGNLCSPCYDPVSGASTSACDLGGDTGPKEGPITFGWCCNDGQYNQGRCVPIPLVPEKSRPQLGRDTCESDELCAPRPGLDDPKWVPQTCREPKSGAEGRCLLACLPSIASQLNKLSVGSCEGNARCAPCFDPLTGNNTGACSSTVADPGPQEPAKVFADCCGGGGRCIPPSAVPAGSPGLWAQECTGGDVCAPDTLVENPGSKLTWCSSVLGDGRCVSRCFLTDDQAFWSTSGACPGSDELCVPCGFAPAGVCT